MDGKGAWRDNVFVERLWRSVKYEAVYPRAYENVSEARSSIGRYLNFYNGRRPHSSLDGMTPDKAYFHAAAPPLVCCRPHARTFMAAVQARRPFPSNSTEIPRSQRLPNDQRPRTDNEVAPSRSHGEAVAAYRVSGSK